MSDLNNTPTAADLEWANEQIESIQPNQEAVKAFDASEDGARYAKIAGMTMWENLGAQSLPARAEDEE